MLEFLKKIFESAFLAHGTRYPWDRDLSARKKIGRANATFRQLLESAPDGIVVVNREGVIAQVNSQAERMFGYSRQELTGEPVEVLLPEQFRHIHAGHRIGYFLKPGVRPMGAGLDLKGRRKDGSGFPVEISLSPIETEEGVLVISAIRDATERKELEQVLREKNVQLEKALAAKDLFLSGMSHELRTPLNAIIGFAGTMLMRLAGPLTADQERQLKTIQASGKRLLSMINDVLDLAKIESGNIEVELKEIPCREVLDEVCSALRPLAEQKSIAFEARFPTEPVTIRTHRRALTQILFKLGSNAVKFTEHGSVRVEMRDRLGDGPRMTAVHVFDTGTGIKPEDQARLSQAFEHARPGQWAEGPGLGLHLCRKLADLIGGHIEFESEYGKGSRFTLLIPRE